MAIDTESKRRSVQGYTVRGPLPLGDGTVTDGDRLAVVGYYAGIPIASVIVKTTALEGQYDITESLLGGG
jgi:hypothetical protein